MPPFLRSGRESTYEFIGFNISAPLHSARFPQLVKLAIHMLARARAKKQFPNPPAGRARQGFQPQPSRPSARQALGLGGRARLRVFAIGTRQPLFEALRFNSSRDRKRRFSILSIRQAARLASFPRLKFGAIVLSMR
jgi:hypothetical protein